MLELAGQNPAFFMSRVLQVITKHYQGFSLSHRDYTRHASNMFCSLTR